MNKQIPIWIQGLNKDGSFNGSYDAIDLEPLSYTEVLQRILKMPLQKDFSEDLCPPQVGFPGGAFAISLTGEDQFYLYPHDITLTSSEIPQYLQQAWSEYQGYPFKPENSQSNSPEFKFCIYCGTKIPFDAIFCPGCGKKQKSL